MRDMAAAMLLFSLQFADTHLFAGQLEDELTRRGWRVGDSIDVQTPAALVSAASFSKSYATKVGPTQLVAVVVPEEQLVWFGTRPKYLLSWNDLLVGVSWQNPSTLVFSDVSIRLKGKNLADVLDAQERLISRDPRALTKLRQYKGVFGLWGDRDIGVVRELSTISFSNRNLILTFMNAEGEATLELAPGFEYVRSIVGDKVIPPNTVEPRPVRTRSEVLRKAAASGPPGASSVVPASVGGLSSARDVVPGTIQTTPVPSATPASLGPTTPVPNTTSSDSPQRKTPGAQTPAVTSEGNPPVWLWVVGIGALIVIVALVLKRRA